VETGVIAEVAVVNAKSAAVGARGVAEGAPKIVPKGAIEDLAKKRGREGRDATRPSLRLRACVPRLRIWADLSKAWLI
jgi:hypothetical protein